MIAHLNNIEPYTEYTQCHFIREEILYRNYFLMTPQGVCDIYLPVNEVHVAEYVTIRSTSRNEVRQ